MIKQNKYDNDLYNEDNYTKIESEYQIYSLNILFIGLICLSFSYNIGKICKIKCSDLFHKCLLNNKLNESLVKDNSDKVCSICLEYLSNLSFTFSFTF